MPTSEPSLALASHHVDALWCDAEGVFVRGWVHCGIDPVTEAWLSCGEDRVDLLPLTPRPDVRQAYPAIASDACGFVAYLPCPPFRPVTLLVGSATGLTRFDVAPPPRATDTADAQGDPFDRFVAAMKAKGGTVLEIGARVVGSLSSLRAPMFAPQCRHLGVDIHPAVGVDLVADAHSLSEKVVPGSISGVFSLAVLEHIAAPWLVAAEINRVLQPGGLTMHLLPQTFPVHEMPNDFWRMTDEALKILFGPATGFEVLEAGMQNPLRIYPSSTWRSGPFLELPFHDGMGASFIIARKVAEVGADDRLWRDVAAFDARSTRYPRH